MRAIATAAACCATSAAAVAAAAAMAVAAAGLADDARAQLRFDFTGIQRTPAAVVDIALHNLRLAAGVLLCAALVPSLGRHARHAVSALLATVLVLNAAAVGVAIAAYGGRLLAATRVHLPLELAGLALAGGAYLQALRQPLRPLALALVGASCLALLLAAAAVETYLLGRPGMSSRARLLAIPLLWLPVLGAAWLYASTHDLGHTWRQFQRGRPLTWPPSTREGAAFDGLAGLPRLLGYVAIVLALTATAVVVARAVHRRRRARAVTRWELRLGRDDLANPYRVQEAFEGITGAIAARWYERIWRGCDHFALETHRLPDLSIRFTVAAPRELGPAIRGPLEDLYPDVELIETAGAPTWARTVVRVEQARAVRALDPDQPQLRARLLGVARRAARPRTITRPPSNSSSLRHPAFVHRRARRLLKRRERALQHADHRDERELGIDSVVEAKELKGALELQHRSLLYFDLRVAGTDPTTVRRAAGLHAQLRSENALVPRQMRVRRRLYARRVELAMPNPLPGLRRGVLSTSELATLWQLPRARVKHARLPRAAVRRAIAPPDIDRDPERVLLRDERGPVWIAPADRKYGHALIGGQGGGKSSVMARHFANDVQDPDRAVILIDPKGPLAELCLGLVPAGRTVHYLDLGRPEAGFNPLAIDATPGVRAAAFVQALIDANPPGAIQAASDSFLRQAVAAVCAIEPEPTLWHVYAMLDFAGASSYRERAIPRLDTVQGADFARNYWHNEFPALVGDRGWAAQALNPPRNKLERLISTREIDTLLRHPHAIDLDEILERGEILIVAGAKAAVGEDNTILVTQLLLQFLHRAIQARQQLDRGRAWPRVAAHRRGPQRPHPIGGQDARRGPLRRPRRRLRLAVHRPDPRRGHPLRRPLTAAVDLDLPHARDGGRPLTRGPGHGGLLRPHLRRPRRTRTPALLSRRRRQAPDPPGHQPLGRRRRPTRRLPRPHAADGTARRRRARRGAPRRPARPRRPPPRVPSRPDPAIRSRTPETRRGRRGAGTAGASRPARTCGNRGRADHVLRPRLMLPASYTDLIRYDGAAVATRPTRSDGAVRDPTTRRRDPRRHLALQVPHRHPATRAALARLRAARRSQAPHQALPRRPRRALPTRSPAPAGRSPGPTTSATTATACSAGPALLDRHARFELRTIYDYRYVLHEIHLNAWILAWRRLLGPALLAWSGETEFEPPAEASGGQMRLDDDRTVRSLRWPTPRLVRPDAILEIERRDGGSRAYLIEYDRTRRIDKNYGKFLRYDTFLCWWWRHTRCSRTATTPRSCCSSAKTTSNERRSSTPPTGN